MSDVQIEVTDEMIEEARTARSEDPKLPRKAVRRSLDEFAKVSTRNEVRTDPPSRAPALLQNGARVVNKDRGRRYVLANPADDDTGCLKYEQLGYRYELGTAHGVRIANGRDTERGKNVEYHGAFLMSISCEEYDLRMAEGDGISLGRQAHKSRLARIYNTATGALPSSPAGVPPAGDKYFSYQGSVKNVGQ